jgi:DNA adenine methylase
VDRTPATPLLRWTGSKRAILPSLVQACAGDFRRYVEPFAGSACLFFALRPRQGIVADTNVRLIDMYRAVRRSPSKVFRALDRLPEPDEGYYRVRAADAELIDPYEGAASFLYLNRCCFNGVYRTNKQGHFNVPRGSRIPPPPTLGQLREVSQALQHIRLRPWDFRRTVSGVEEGDLVYLDPPFSRAKHPHYGLYGYGGFGRDDVESLGDSLARIDRSGATFVLSYGGSESEALASGWYSYNIAVRRQVAGRASRRSVASEVLVSNRELNLGIA